VPAIVCTDIAAVGGSTGRWALGASAIPPRGRGGHAVGNVVTASPRALVGDSVGVVGTLVGASVGALGAFVGDSVGVVGALVGDSGASVGALVGPWWERGCMGALVGDFGGCVGASVNALVVALFFFLWVAWGVIWWVLSVGAWAWVRGWPGGCLGG
jgi:hypothetical protein